MGFPRLYAAASLKRWSASARVLELELGFPRLYAAASLKQLRDEVDEFGQFVGFPRLYAAASLKPRRGLDIGLDVRVFRGFMPRPH